MMRVGGDDVRTVIVSGTLTGAAATDLEKRLEAESDGASRVVIDFSQVRDFSDFGLAIVARALGRRGPNEPPVELRGLRQHQLRMFRYLGFDASSPRRIAGNS